MAAAFNPMKETPETVGTTFRPMREESATDAAAGAVRRPRDLVDRPEMFGLWGKPMRAAPGVDPTDAAFIAANVQHWVANAIREEVAMSLSNLATLLPSLDPTSPDMTFDHIAQFRRGEIPMTLTDLLVWSRRFEAVRDIVTSTLADRPHAGTRMTPPADGGMGPVITTGRGKAAEG
ncbi:hypothetical protein QF046_002836 [Microbacterium sp. W4I4]|uniref:hypothetical protein n=1 Tax=Microbacterium sp. W4I4 TaxID=3042295 RepID=UPI00278709C3|nr:hypothetical protein [Microbacterium sp. W4I4]MDQ0615195.1 hypothetical protein [Microbacterium sp. W4I4]